MSKIMNNEPTFLSCFRATVEDRGFMATLGLCAVYHAVSAVSVPVGLIFLTIVISAVALIGVLKTWDSAPLCAPPFILVFMPLILVMQMSGYIKASEFYGKSSYFEAARPYFETVTFEKFFYQVPTEISIYGIILLSFFILANALMMKYLPRFQSAS